jgi:hypothetical protein
MFQTYTWWAAFTGQRRKKQAEIIGDLEQVRDDARVRGDHDEIEFWERKIRLAKRVHALRGWRRFVTWLKLLWLMRLDVKSEDRG